MKLKTPVFLAVVCLAIVPSAQGLSATAGASADCFAQGALWLANAGGGGDASFGAGDLLAEATASGETSVSEPDEDADSWIISPNGGGAHAFSGGSLYLPAGTKVTARGEAKAASVLGVAHDTDHDEDWCLPSADDLEVVRVPYGGVDCRADPRDPIEGLWSGRLLYLERGIDGDSADPIFVGDFITSDGAALQVLWHSTVSFSNDWNDYTVDEVEVPADAQVVRGIQFASGGGVCSLVKSTIALAVDGGVFSLVQGTN